MIEVTVADFYDALFGVANIVLTCFVFFYAIFFVLKVVKHKNREPWEYLLSAIIILLVTQLLDVLKAMHVFYVIGLRNILQVIFLGTVLIAFVTQTEITKGKKKIKRIIYRS